jgi:RNA polymerase sigma-70 factor (ECF subfamily)
MTAELPHDESSDEALMAQVVSGEKQAFTVLFRRHKDDVYRVALLMTGRPPVAEDVTQDVFLAVMREAHRYEPGRSTVAAWLCGIARNQARRRLERDSRVVALNDGDESGDEHSAIHPDPVTDMALARDVDALRRAILTLPLRYREVVVLCDLQELSYADAAAALDCAVGTVRSRLHRGRTLLAAKMRRHGDVRGSVVKGCLA